MSLTLRDATADDIHPLAVLVAASYRAAFLPIIGETGLTLRGMPFFVDRFSAEWPHIRVAMDGHGQLIAMAEVRDGTLDMLFVSPGHTGNGTGALMLADAERRGAHRLECFAANLGARSFYARQGWRETASYARAFAGATHAFVAMDKP